MSKSRALANPRWERFCQLWVFGNPKHDPEDPASPPDPKNHVTRSYEQAGYVARGNAANTCGCRLLRKAQVQARIEELRAEEQRLSRIYMRRWKTLLPAAQQLLLDAVEGTKEVSAQQLAAAREIVEQAQGPTRFRFGVAKGADSDAGLSVTIWSGRRGDDG